MIKSHPIYNEVAQAYADCNEDFDESVGEPTGPWNKPAWDKLEEIRNLGYRASQSVNAETAAAIMRRACPEYNGFTAELLELLPNDCEIFLAREGSVCIYVRPGKKRLPSARKLNADEYDVMKQTSFAVGHHSKDPSNGIYAAKTDYGGFEGEVRIWWD